MLAVLLVAANQIVPTEQLIDRVWGERPPARVRNVLSGYITRLRTVIVAAGDATGDVRLSRRSGGYQLSVPPDHVDLHLFRALVADSRDAAAAEQSALLGDALDLWRGPAFAATTGAWLDALRESLERERLAARVARADAVLSLGRATEVVDDLVGLAAEHPLDERVAARLMLALRASARPAEALAVYATMRGRLADEFGVEPGTRLRQLHRELLDSDDDPPPPRSARAMVPRQLPPVAAHFTGRDVHIGALEHRRTALAAARPGTAATVVIHGSAGVGKTTLAVYWAHQAAADFPDGQIYLNLRGFDQNQPPLPAAEALTALLRALDVAPRLIPASVDEQSALFRSVIADRRILVVLDNAAASGQVRPLLPGAGGCLVVVTSRNELSGLAASDGVTRLALDVLARPDAVALLDRVAGPRLVEARAQDIDALAALCADLPLALRVVANHLVARPDATVPDILDELTDEGYRLDALATDEEATSVRAVFALSYHALKPEAARAFRLLGLHEGAQFSELAAAALIDIPLGAARGLLAELCRGHLLERVADRRYQFHDLLRLYAFERATVEESAEELRHHVRRVLSWYHAVAAAGDRILAPGVMRLDLHDSDVQAADATGPWLGFADQTAALAWFETESRNLVAAVRQADAAGEYRLAWQLTVAQIGFFSVRTPWVDWLTTHEIALEAARRTGDRVAEATVLNSIGNVHYYPRRFDEAETYFTAARDIWLELGNVRGQALIANNIGNVMLERRRLPEAIAWYEAALAMSGAGEVSSEAALTLTNVAEANCLLGRFGPALDFAERALRVHRASGDHRAQALTLCQSGNALRGLGRTDEAFDHYGLAVAVAARIGDRQAQAWACHFTAEANADAGRQSDARAQWDRAVSLFDSIGDPQAADIRAQLATRFAADEVL